MDLRSPRTIVPLLLAAAVAAFVVAHLVVTDVEAIEGLVEDLGEAAGERDFAAIERAISEDYRDAEGRDRAVAMLRVRKELRTHVPRVEARAEEVRVVDGTATAKVRLRVVAYGRLWRLEMVFTLREEEGEWRVLAADLVRWE